MELNQGTTTPRVTKLAVLPNELSKTYTLFGVKIDHYDKYQFPKFLSVFLQNSSSGPECT